MSATHADLLDLAAGIAGEAAELIRTQRAAGVRVAATKSTEVDVVTETDRAAEELIRRRIAEHRPEDAVLGEEGGAEEGASEVRWIVDPIDGTVNFLYGIPAYSVSIAVEVAGEVVAGVVVDVAASAAYTAVKGGGAFLDGSPLQVRRPVPLAQRLLVTGFGYDAGNRAVQAAAVGRALAMVRDIRRFGSCALDLCRVAEGTVDAYLEEGLNVWDFAAGVLIAREAGARVEIGDARWSGHTLACGPEEGFDDLRRLVAETAFFGG